MLYIDIVLRQAGVSTGFNDETVRPQEGRSSKCSRWGRSMCEINTIATSLTVTTATIGGRKGVLIRCLAHH